jgi:hypothetical protein
MAEDGDEFEFEYTKVCNLLFNCFLKVENRGKYFSVFFFSSNKSMIELMREI